MKRKYINRFFLKMESRNDVYQEDDIRYLRQLAKAKNSEIRSKVAELLSTCEQEFAEAILFKMTYDKNEIVRADAVDSLGIGKSQQSFRRLRHLMECDRSELVQFHAVLSYVDVFWNMDQVSVTEEALIEELEFLLKKEELDHVKLSYYEALYNLGRTMYLDDLLCLLQDASKANNGTLVWHALHSLENILNDNLNQEYIDKMKNLKLSLTRTQKSYYDEMIQDVSQ